MTVPSSTNKSGPYDCNGSLTEFAGTFRILAEDDIDVVLTDADGNDQNLVLTTDYSVTPTGGSTPCDTFTVTTVSTYSSSYTITIIRDIDFTQEANFGNSGPYLPEVHEESFDRAVMQVQQLKEEVDRSVKFGPGVDLSGVTVVVDGDGTLILTYLQDGSVTTSKIGDAAVTLAKMANLAQDTIVGRETASTGVPEAIACTAAGRALLDDASASAQRTTLGLGNSATLGVGTSAGTVAAGDDSRFTVTGIDYENLLIVEAQVATDTDGAAHSGAGAWDAATINTVVHKGSNLSAASLASDQISDLPAGDYKINGWVTVSPDDGRADMNARLYDATGAAVVINQTPLKSDFSGTDTNLQIMIAGVATLTGSEDLELQVYWTNDINVVSLLFGRDHNNVGTNVYLHLEILKVG